MIFKNRILATVLFVLLFSSFLKVKGQCTVNQLDISTGRDHATNTNYAGNANDQYWLITNAPQTNTAYPVNVCSKSWNFSFLNIAPGSSSISIVNAWANADGNVKNVNCNTVGAPYQFQRKIKINLPNNITSTTGSLTFSYSADDFCESANISGPSLNYSFPTTSCNLGGTATVNT